MGLFRRIVTQALVIVLAIELYACGGGGGSGDNHQEDVIEPIGDVSGDWNYTTTVDASDCGEAILVENGVISVNQSGNSLTVVTPNTTATGTFSGTTITWSGTYPDDGGTTNESVTLTVAQDCNSYTGSSAWTWSDGSTSCRGTAEYEGVRVNQVASCTNTAPITEVTDPLITGFDFNLTKGDFWEYGWDYESSFTSSSGSRSSSEQSHFRITLGDSITIDGNTFYEMLLSGNTKHSETGDVAPNGKYIAVSNHRFIVLDEDQATQGILFDAMTGHWPGSGLFTNFSSDTLFEATLSTLSNDYINQPAYQVSVSTSESQCEYYPGVGTICGGDNNENLIKREYYDQAVGPLGYYGHSSMSDPNSSDGGWWSTTTTHIGLTTSSLRGDAVDYELEVEPNNLIEQATPISLPARIKGDNASEEYLGGTTAVSVGEASITEGEPNDSPFSSQNVLFPSSISGDIHADDSSTTVTVQTTPGGTTYTTSFEDWYAVTLSTSITLNVSLEFPDSSSDIDMYLFSLDNSNEVIIHGNSIVDNVATGVYSEQISRPLNTGTYYVALDAYDTSNGRADYTLDITTSASTLDICDWFSFSLPNQRQIHISVSGGAGFVLTDATGNTTLTSGSEQGATIILDPGNYLIGVSDEDRYTLEVNTP